MSPSKTSKVVGADALEDIEALVLLEIDGMARAIACQDSALKKAEIRVLACAPVSPGKALLIFGGDVAASEEAMQSALELCGSRLMDHMMLPGIHPQVVWALSGNRLRQPKRSLAILEFGHIGVLLRAADSAVKCAPVSIGHLHPASGYGGKGFFTLYGELYDLEAACEEAIACGPEMLTDHELIAAPHGELDQTLLHRPWPVDPLG